MSRHAALQESLRSEQVVVELGGPLGVVLLATLLPSLVHFDHPLVHAKLARESSSHQVGKLLRLAVIVAVVFRLVRRALKV